MNIKRAIKLTPFKLFCFVVLYIILWFLHILCRPMAVVPRGDVFNCGCFSRLIWNNQFLYNVYTGINGWWLLLITWLLIFIFFLLREYYLTTKRTTIDHQAEKRKKNKLSWPISIAIIIIGFLLLLFFFFSSF